MLKAVVKVRSQARRRRAKDLIRRHLKRRCLQCRRDLPWLDFINNWRRTYTFFCQLEAVQISRSRPTSLPFLDRPLIKFACKESGARDDCVKCPKKIFGSLFRLSTNRSTARFNYISLKGDSMAFFRSTRLDICQREGVPYLGNAVEYLKNLRRTRIADWNVFRSWFVVVSSLERSQSSPATQYHGLQTATGSYFWSQIHAKNVFESRLN